MHAAARSWARASRSGKRARPRERRGEVGKHRRQLFGMCRGDVVELAGEDGVDR